MQKNIFLALDESFILQHGEVGENILSISSWRFPQNHSYLYIKNRKFFKEIPSNLFRDYMMGVIWEKKFFEDNKDEIVTSDIYISSLWSACVESVAIHMTKASFEFYSERFNHLNLLLDGRQTMTAQISPYADIAQGVFIGDHVTIEDDVIIYPGVKILPHSRVGKGSILYSGVVLYPYVEVGEYCRIHSNVVIGADGFGYNFFGGLHQKVWHFGGVKIASHVEIGANSTVDAGVFHPTLIGDGTKIDNLVQIAHNVIVGKHCIICGLSGLAGSVVLEDYVIIAGRVGVAPGVYIGKGSKVAGNSILSENSIWPGGSEIGGDPATDLKKWMRFKARLRSMAMDKSSLKFSENSEKTKKE